MVERSETALLYQTDRYLRLHAAQVLTVDPALRPIPLVRRVFSTASGGTHVTKTWGSGGPEGPGARSTAKDNARIEIALTSPTVPPTSA